MLKDLPLNVILAMLGYTTEPSNTIYKRNVLKSGVVVFKGDCFEVFAWLRSHYEMLR